MAAVELAGTLIDRIDDDEPRGYRVAGDDRDAEGIGEQACAQPRVLLVAIDGQPSDQNHPDRGRRQPTDQAGRWIGALNRAHRQADVARDATPPNHDEGSRRVGLLGDQGVSTQPVVEVSHAARERRERVTRLETLETQVVAAQLRGSGSARRRSTSSGATVAGSSRVA